METNTDFLPTRSHTLTKNPNGTWSAARKEFSGSTVKDYLILASNVNLDSASDALIKDGVEDEAIDTAVSEMFKNDHNFAEFGIFGGFVYSDYLGAKH